MTTERFCSSLFLILLLLVGSGTPLFAAPTNYAHELPTIQSPERRAEFVQNRIDYIADVAKLTAEEKNTVALELEKYDANKLSLFRQSLDIRKRLETEELTDDEATQLLDRALKLDERRTAETSQLFARLKDNKIPTKKLTKIYIGLVDHKRNYGREIREKRRTK